MAMNPRLLRPRASSALVATDADAKTYINAVRTADGGQYMEAGVQRAIDAFVIGCKADGIWSEIKASCLLMGARTLSGALVPLVGPTPTNNGPFVSGDYNRKTGLIGNASTKYIDSGRSITANPNDDNHFGLYVSSTPATSGSQFYCGGQGADGRGLWVNRSATPSLLFRNQTVNTGAAGNGSQTGFIGCSRQGGPSFVIRENNSSTTINESSAVMASANWFVLARNVNGTVGGYTDARIAFYSLGEHLDLALLDSRVTTLYNAIGAAIP